MPGTLSIRRMGVLVGLVTAVPYVVVLLASQALVGVLTTGSWQAAFLGLGWHTIVGFELGLLVVIGAGFAAAAAIVPAWSAIWGSHAGRPQFAPRATKIAARSAPRLAYWSLVACLLLPAVALVALRGLAPVLSTSSKSAAAPAGEGVDAGRSQPVNLGAAINTAFRDAEPSFTADGRTMAFNCQNGDICVSHLVGTWEASNWTTPERLGAPISTEYEEVEPIINAAGDKLYFTSRRPGGRLVGIPFLSPFINVIIVFDSLTGGAVVGGLGLSDVWVSTWVDGRWTEPQTLNAVPGEPPINTAFDDHCLFFSANGAEAFWTSTRPGGLGEDDIWTARRVGGVWTEPENLGPNVNSSASEHHSIPTPGGESLYVTTTRVQGFGGEDNYVTTRDPDGQWGPLVNLGPMVNGPGDDRCPAWTPDFKVFLIDSVRAGGFGGRDLWWLYYDAVPGHMAVP